MDEPLAHYIEEVALHYEQYGVPRIGGRVVGLLLVCDPPHRSSKQLAEELGVSKGSISSMTRLMLDAGTIEVFPVPGDRCTYYRLCADGMERKFERRLTSMVAFRALAERGLALLDGSPPERTERLRKLASMYRFLERELPPLLERWRMEEDDG